MAQERLVASHTGEAAYVVDGQQRIIEWSAAAAALVGVPQGHAVGRPCYEVVRGSGIFGRMGCAPNCQAFRALRHGQRQGWCSILVDRGCGVVGRLRCDLFALPHLPGGALARLREKAEAPLAGEVLDRDADSPATSPAGGVLGGLAALANLSTVLSGPSISTFEDSVGQVLDILRTALGAESAELFLSERQPVSQHAGGMVLTAYRGPFRNAFSEITYFPAGQGYPGLVLVGREAIATSRLPEDPRYLRTRVKQMGFHSYACMPLLGAGGAVGCLNLAWRRADAPLDEALRLLQWASGPVAAALENSLSRLRDVGTSIALDNWGADSDLDLRLHEMLRRIMDVGNATGATLVLKDPATDAILKRLLEGQPPRPPRLAPGRCDDVCPARAEGRAMAFCGPKEKWPIACQHSASWPAVTYCLPIIAGGQYLGMVQLGYVGQGPVPPTKYLRLTAEMAGGAAHLAREVLLTYQRQRLLTTLGGDVLVRLPAVPPLPSDPIPTIRADGSPALRAAGGPAPLPEVASPGKGLELRGLGSFELFRDGRLVPAGAFRRAAALTLLRILALHYGRPLSRETLAEMLWPEVEPDASAQRLYVTVHALRKVLEPGVGGPRSVPALERAKGRPKWKYVCQKGDQYYLDPTGPVRVDIHDFAAYVRRGEALEREGNIAEAMRAYDAAAGLYRGDLFPDEPYAEWCSRQRDHLRQQYIEVTRKLASLCMAQGNADACVEYCRRALAVDPALEEVHQQLMMSLWKANRRSDALRQYQVCSEVLRDQLDVEPLPETKRMLELIKRSRQ